MAGTLTISTLSDGTNSTSSTNCIQGSAKAWANWSTSGAINKSYNVSSVTKTGTGSYTVNMTNAMPNTSYAVVVGNYPVWWTQVGTITSTTAFSVSCFQGGSFGNTDPTQAWATVFSTT
jgi:hypothetical protein